MGPAGARIVRDISLAADTEATADATGKWSMQVSLSEGSNDLVFRVGDDRTTEVRLAVTYVKTAPVARLGKPIVVDGLQITVLKAQVSTGSTYFRPPSGYIWVGYKVRFKAIDGARTVSVSDWVTLADGSRQGEWTIASVDSWDPVIGLTELRQGASTTGWITFEVPKPKKYIRLIYDPSLFSDDPKLTLDVKYP
jgi:hypothetical protein